MPPSAAATSREPSGLRVLTLTTLQQAGLTAVRFGLPILAPFWREALHLSLGQVGLLLGAFDLGAFLLLIPLGLLSDRWGEPVVLGAGALFTAVMTATISRAHGFWSLVLLLAVAGMGYGSGQTAGSKAVSDAFGSGGRGTAMGIRQSGLPLGGMVAALLLPPLAGTFGWQAAIAAAATVCAIPGVLCWIALRDLAGNARSADPRAHRAPVGRHPVERAGRLLEDVRAVLRNTGVRRTTETSMLLVVAQFCFLGYFALYLVDHFRWSKPAAAGLLVVVHLGGVLGRLGWGAFSDRRYAGRRVPALAWCVGAGVLFPVALMALSPADGVPVVALVALAGGVLLLGWNGLFATLIAESASAGRAATSMGVSMTFLFATTMVTPALFGWLVDHTSYAVGWTSLVGVMAWALLVTYRIPEPVPARLPTSEEPRRLSSG